ncbi:MAG: SURF1 family protein [Jatrophihabitans sp.]
MFRSALWTLRQPRYAKLAALMFILALICVVAGTWQISRFKQSVRENNVLDGNAHAAVAPLTSTPVSLVNQGSGTNPATIRFRTVTVSGTYLVGRQEFLRDQSLNNEGGFYVLNPLRTPTGVLLVVRGFVAGGDPPSTVEAPPAGLVHITGRLQATTTTNDGASLLGKDEIASINPAQQASRLGEPVYETYLTLNSGQPGTAGVKVLPGPDLSNPAGGAYEGQHFAYIVQWYLFALLALAAPFAMSRFELREARQRFLGIDTGNEELDLEAGRDLDQRRQLTAGTSAAGVVATRGSGTLVQRYDLTPERWQQAARLADRYGRALSNDRVEPAVQSSTPSHTARAPVVGHDQQPPSSATNVHRSHDNYHGSYNDYLWQLGLADGATPDIPLPQLQPGGPMLSTPRRVLDEQPVLDERPPTIAAEEEA